MTETLKQVTINVGVGPDADRQDLDRLTRLLKKEIEDGVIGVQRVEFKKEDDVARGAKPAMAVVLGSLVADVLPAALEKMVDLLKWWSGRNGGCTVVLKYGKDELRLTGVTKDQEDRLIQEWVARHGTK